MSERVPERAHGTRVAPPTRAPIDPISLFAYRTLLVAFNGFLVTAWMPRLATIGDGDVGAGVLLLAAMVPLALLAPARARLDRQAEGYRTAVFLAVGFTLFWGCLGVFRIDDPFRAGRLILSLGQGLILLYLVSAVFSPRALRFSVALSGAVLVGISLLSLYNYLGGPPTELTLIAHDRSAGLFKNPNQYGMILAMGVPFAVALYSRHRGALPATVLLVAIVLGLLLAASKTNLVLGLLLLFAVAAYALVARRRFATLLVVLPGLVLAGTLGALPLLELFNPRAAAILVEIAAEGGTAENDTVAQRVEMWRHSLEQMRASPLFGEGTGQIIDTGTQVHPHAHNIFMDLGRTTGLPGLLGGATFILLACWCAVATLVRLRRLPESVTPYLPGHAIVVGAGFAVLSYVASNQMSDSLGPSTSTFFWLCLGLLLRRDELLFSHAPVATRGEAYEPSVALSASSAR